MLSNLDYIQRMIQKGNPAAKAHHMAASQASGGRKLSIMMMPYQLVTGEESTREAVTMMDYRSLLVYVNDTDPKQR